MNTEAMNTLKIVRDAITELQPQLNDKSLNDDDRNLIEQALNDLYDIEDTIIYKSLQAMVDKINASNADLQNLIAQMQCSSDKIAKLVQTIEKVSKVIGIFSEITEKAINAGLAG